MKLIPNPVARKFARQILIAQKNSPRFLFVGGVVGTVASTVLACRATLKLSDTLEEVEESVSEIKIHHDNPAFQYPDNHYRKDLVYIYAKGGAKVVRLYAPAIIIGVASVGALTTSHVALTRRNAGLTAAYAAVQKGFDEYRDRVKAELGEEKELDIYRGIVPMEIKGDDGKKMIVAGYDPNKLSIYAKIFDESNRHWEKNAEYNRLFIQAKQNYMNNLLLSRGHVFLNEVYDELGFEHTQAGSVVGWVYDKNGGASDNYIDFGMFEAGNSLMVNGYERSIVLDFNVDGSIWDRIGK